jgi:hypothetical protein
MHAEVVDEPLPEWLEDAACGPAVKHLAHLAMHTADAHGDEAAWREWIDPHARARGVRQAHRRGGGMHARHAGLWPWRT